MHQWTLVRQRKSLGVDVSGCLEIDAWLREWGKLHHNGRCNSPLFVLLVVCGWGCGGSSESVCEYGTSGYFSWLSSFVRLIAVINQGACWDLDEPLDRRCRRVSGGTTSPYNSDFPCGGAVLLSFSLSPDVSCLDSFTFLCLYCACLSAEVMVR